MTRTVKSMRAWALVAAIGIVALTGASVAQAASSDPAASTSTVTKGDLTEKLSWTGQLAYANAASLTYKGGQSDAGARTPSAVALTSATIATKTAAFSVSFATSTALSTGAAPSPSVSPVPSPSPVPTSTPVPTPSPEPTASPEPSPSPKPPTGGGVTCPCVGGTPSGLTGSLGGTSSSGTGTTSTPTVTAVGLVTWLPAAGSVVSSGGVLYRVDNQPVVLLEGKATLYRDLKDGDTGDDVQALETALAALGYGANMTVDNTFTSVTAANLKAFQTAMGIDATGSLDLTTVVMHDGPVVVSTLVAAVGDEATSGMEILVMADQERDVTVSLDPAQLTSIAVGDTISVKLLDGSSADATVAFIAAAPASDGTFALTARLDPSVTVAGDHLTVTVSYSRVLATDALLIDPYALVLLEGNHTVVRVIRAGVVSDVEVAVIATAGRSTAVSSADLKEGDTIES